VAEDQDHPETGTDAPKGTRAIKDRNQRIREEAAQKRKSRRDADQRRANVQRNLDASELVDDALARGTHAATGWLKRHLNVIQWVIVVGALGGIGWEVFSSYRHKTEAKGTDSLMVGVTAEFARVGDQEEVDVDPATGLDDSRPHYADDAARLKAATDAYKATSGSETIRTLADLGLAGTLYDAGNFKDALATYDRVQKSALAQKDNDVRLRALEGVGLAHEGLGEKDAAKKAFHELGNSDSTLFSALGLFQEGRLALATGDRDGAKELLKKALDKVTKDESAERPPGFVSQAARELLTTIDPSAVPPLPTKNTMSAEQLQAMANAASGKKGGIPSGLSKEKLDELLRQLKEHPPQPAPTGAPAGKP
jgi:tetratricopeptide (TPR) repeat protein